MTKFVIAIPRNGLSLDEFEDAVNVAMRSHGLIATLIGPSLLLSAGVQAFNHAGSAWSRLIGDMWSDRPNSHVSSFQRDSITGIPSHFKSSQA